MKKGYWVAKANVIDGDKQGAYGKLAEEVIAKFNGKFLVRGGVSKLRKKAQNSCAMLLSNSLPLKLLCKPTKAMTISKRLQC